jgi:C4-dicarboxylate-specific signal transduction histidine kinase
MAVPIQWVNAPCTLPYHVTNEVLWRKDGTSFPVSYFSSPLIWKDQCIGSVVSFEDLTEQKKLQQQLEIERQKSVQNAKLASLGELSAGLAHEINNPLTIISGTIPLLERFKTDPDKFAAKLTTLQRSVERIAKIVRGLKKFTRAEAASDQRLRRRNLSRS